MSTRRRENDDPSLRELLDLSQRLTKRARMENGDDDVISSSSEGEGDSESDIDEPSELDAPLPADEDG